MTFASAVFPSKHSETQALLLADSIRSFAGTFSCAPIWYFTPEHGQQLSEAVRDKLLALDVSLPSFKIPSEVLRFPFAGYVFAASLAESTACGQADFLAWLATDTVVLQEPKDFLLQSGRTSTLACWSPAQESVCSKLGVTPSSRHTGSPLSKNSVGKMSVTQYSFTRQYWQE